MHENISKLSNSIGRKTAESSNKHDPPQLSDFTDDPPDAGNATDEMLRLVGDCVWLIFSNNHTVCSTTGGEYNLGSFRGSAGFIADFINMHHPAQGLTYDYMDFYCAGWFNHDFADTTPVFVLLFQRLKAYGCDWVYAYPRMHLVDFSHGDANENDSITDPAGYDPAKAMQQQLENQQKRTAADALREEFDNLYDASREDAKFKPPPVEVKAYWLVFGHPPAGSPHGE